MQFPFELLDTMANAFAVVTGAVGAASWARRRIARRRRLRATARKQSGAGEGGRSRH